MIRVKLPLTGNPAHDAEMVADLLTGHPDTRLMVTHDGYPTGPNDQTVNFDWIEFEAHRLVTADTVIPARTLKHVPRFLLAECRRQHQERAERAAE